MPMPLHIFEPRYRQLLADCMGGDRSFGILLKEEGAEEGSLPRGHVGCVAHIESTQALPDGRSNIVVTGVGRFALERIVESDRPYFVGEVREFDDVDEPELELRPLSERVRRTFERVGRAARVLSDDRDPLPSLPDDAAYLSFAIGALIDIDLGARQRLLASRSAAARLRELDQLLSAVVESLESRASVHVRAKANGRGPHAAI
jgi:Lon protease-like protein